MRQRVLKNERGFTFIELLLVTAIIGILVAIAIPMLTNYRNKVYNAAATSDLRVAKVSLEAHFSEKDHYPY
ncbi:MAG: pilus assembly protein [Desulfuromonas sp.]|nr:MAG: pilus assembly protein [Desulfuromonas sp.]